MTATMTDFEEKLARWLVGAQKLIDDHYATNYPNLDVPKLKLERGKRYVHVDRFREAEVNGKLQVVERSAHAIVDTRNGDVLKPAGWRVPAKHARGNILDEHNGLRYMSSYGPAYLR